jgi:hypothetical protein
MVVKLCQRNLSPAALLPDKEKEGSGIFGGLLFISKLC